LTQPDARQTRGTPRSRRPPTAPLAAFYGLPAPSADVAVVERPAGQGIGLPAQASVHSSLAQPDSSSPTAGTDCPGCHVLFDPIGYGFEHFDELGRYRATENGLPIMGVPTVGARVSGQLTTWVFGGSWACLGEGRRSDFVGGTIGFIDYLSSLAGEPQFVERTLP
jgi:hypothetical protein